MARVAELAHLLGRTARSGSRARSARRGRARRGRPALIWSNRLVIWNERAMPRWAICSGCSPVMSRPPKRIWPERGREEAGEQVEQRGLAGAVGADQGVHGALGDAQVDVGDGAEAAELLGQGAGLEQGSCRAGGGVAGHRHLLVRLERRRGLSRFCRTLGALRAPDMAGSSTQMHQNMSVAHIRRSCTAGRARQCQRTGCTSPGMSAAGSYGRPAEPERPEVEVARRGPSGSRRRPAAPPRGSRRAPPSPVVRGRNREPRLAPRAPRAPGALGGDSAGVWPSCPSTSPRRGPGRPPARRRRTRASAGMGLVLGEECPAGRRSSPAACQRWRWRRPHSRRPVSRFDPQARRGSRASSRRDRRSARLRRSTPASRGRGPRSRPDPGCR